MCDKVETVEEYLARGGKIEVLEPELIDHAKAKMKDEGWFIETLEEIEEGYEDDYEEEEKK